MVNYKSRKGMTLLYREKLSGTSTSILFTENLDMLNQWEEIVIFGSIVSTLTLEVRLLISALTDYDFEYILQNSTVVSGVETDAGGTAVILPIAINTGPLVSNFELHIRITHPGGGMSYNWKAGHANEGQVIGHGKTAGVLTSISSLNIHPSTSSFAANTEVSIYGLSR